MSKDLTDALRAITEASRPKPDDKPQPRGAARRVIAAATPPAVAAGGGGDGGVAASPWTETSRTYWPAAWQTTDGLFSFPAVRKVTFLDADGGEIELNFANPAP